MKKIIAVLIIAIFVNCFIGVSADSWQSLSQNDLLGILSGYVYYTVDANGYIDMSSFTPEQSSYFINQGEFYRQFVETEQTMINFNTNTASFKFDYILEGTYGYFEVFVDGACQVSQKASSMANSGTYSYSLDGGQHRIDIYIPRCGMKIKNFAYTTGSVNRVQRTKALFYGDSITYGYLHERSSDDYVSRLSRAMDYETVNYGVGGYYFDGGQVIAQNTFVPDIIFVAYGANDTVIINGLQVNCKAFMDNLTTLYPTQKIYVITPLWANDNETRINNLPYVRSTITSVCESVLYPNVTVIDGLPLVPNSSAYFLDGVHPNVQGNTLYAQNLVPFVTPKATISDVTVDKNQKRISWNVSDGQYDGVNVYVMNFDNTFSKTDTVKNVAYYDYTESGIYAVKSVNDNSYITEKDYIYAEDENTVHLSISNGRITEKGAGCTVTYINNSPNYVKAVIRTEILDENENVLRYHYQTVGINGLNEKSFGLYLSAKGADSIRISAVDTVKSGNRIADDVIFQ